MAVIDNHAYLYGGRGQKLVNDLCILNTDKWTWTKRKMEGNFPYHGRYCHSFNSYL